MIFDRYTTTLAPSNGRSWTEVVIVVNRKYDVIDLEKGTLDRSVFTDAQTYQDELEQIFGRAWLMLTHESLIPNPNDFFLSYMGEDPVIVTRDAKGEFHVFLNMCRHRGNRVVRADDGNAKNFMCTYHGWTFSNEGKLVSVPGLQEAYYGELDVEHLGLVEARCDTYAGIIFATWAENAPTLEAYLGDARWYLDTVYNRRDCGQQAYGPLKWVQPFNWKAPVDNASDNYHVPVTHIASEIVRYQFGRPRNAALGHKALFALPAKHLFVNGHSLTFRLHEAVGRAQRMAILGRTEANDPIFQKFQQETVAEEERRLGTFRALQVSLGNHSLFPNTAPFQLRFGLPRGPFHTEFWHFRLTDKDAPEVIRREMLSGSSRNNGPGGLNEQDDIDNWAQMTGSGKLVAHREIGHQVSMGIGHATTSHPEFVGLVSERYISENNQRNFHSRWQEFMKAGSWKDIHIDPITAKFEGTATMKS